MDAKFDVELAKAIAGLESYNKHLYRPNTYLHKWWARRCGSTFRLILKHLVENEHQRCWDDEVSSCTRIHYHDWTNIRRCGRNYFRIAGWPTVTSGSIQKGSTV